MGRFCAVETVVSAGLTCMKVTVAEPVSESQGGRARVAPPLTSAWLDANGGDAARQGPLKAGGSMFRTIRLMSVGVVAVLALAVPSFAAQAKAAAKPAKAAAAKTMTVSGTLQKVEGQDLT